MFCGNGNSRLAKRGVGSDKSREVFERALKYLDAEEKEVLGLTKVRVVSLDDLFEAKDALLKKYGWEYFEKTIARDLMRALLAAVSQEEEDIFVSQWEVGQV